jgi:hypothetical protein
VPAAEPATATPANTAVTPANTPNVSVSRGTVTSCRTTAGDTLKGGDCGAVPGLDGIVVPRLRKLAECPASVGASGRLRLAVRADFARGSLSADLGRGAPPAGADALLECVRTDLRGAAIAALTHENARYSIAYVVHLGGGDAEPSAAAPSAGATATPAPAPETGAGIASVAWDVALVRDAPKTGKVLARLPRGTALRVGAASDGWVPVKYGDQFASEGWVYHSAIGR